jgi:hypothetical protein
MSPLHSILNRFRDYAPDTIAATWLDHGTDAAIAEASQIIKTSPLTDLIIGFDAEQTRYIARVELAAFARGFQAGESHLFRAGQAKNRIPESHITIDDWLDD